MSYNIHLSCLWNVCDLFLVFFSGMLLKQKPKAGENQSLVTVTPQPVKQRGQSNNTWVYDSMSCVWDCLNGDISVGKLNSVLIKSFIWHCCGTFNIHGRCRAFVVCSMVLANEIVLTFSILPLMFVKLYIQQSGMLWLDAFLFILESLVYNVFWNSG